MCIAVLRRLRAARADRLAPSGPPTGAPAGLPSATPGVSAAAPLPPAAATQTVPIAMPTPAAAGMALPGEPWAAVVGALARALRAADRASKRLLLDAHGDAGAVALDDDEAACDRELRRAFGG